MTITSVENSNRQCNITQLMIGLQCISQNVSFITMTNVQQ